MAISTEEKKSGAQSKKAKIASLFATHKPTFDALGIKNPKFIPKMAYMPRAGAEQVIALFPSEIQGGKDVFTEFVSKDYDPEDEERTLWRWEFNEHYEEEYEKTDPHPVSGHCRYLIPTEELVKVATAHSSEKEEEKATEEQSALDLSDWPKKDGDDPISTLTIRDKCAIDWKKPVSGKQWLNELIIETFPEK